MDIKGKGWRRFSSVSVVLQKLQSSLKIDTRPLIRKEVPLISKKILKKIGQICLVLIVKRIVILISFITDPWPPHFLFVRLGNARKGTFENVGADTYAKGRIGPQINSFLLKRMQQLRVSTLKGQQPRIAQEQCRKQLSAIGCRDFNNLQVGYCLKFNFRSQIKTRIFHISAILFKTLKVFKK